MTTINLVSPVVELFADRPTLDRLLRAVSLERAVSYVETLERLHDAIDNGATSVRTALESAGFAASEDVAKEVTLLERIDRVVADTFHSQTEPLRAERTDSRGMVLLDQQKTDPGSPFMRAILPEKVPSGGGLESLNDDIGKVLADPQEFERRLQRARRAAPAGLYDGDTGRKRFQEQDRQHAEAGIDLVRSYERPLELATANAGRSQLRRRLEQAIGREQGTEARARALDAAVSELGSSQAPNETLPSAGLKTLEQLAPERSDVSPQALELDRRIRDRLHALDLPWSEYANVCRQLMAEEASAVTDEPRSAHPDSQRMDQRVRERLKQLGKGDSEYPVVLEQMMAEDSAQGI